MVVRGVGIVFLVGGLLLNTQVKASEVSSTIGNHVEGSTLSSSFSSDFRVRSLSQPTSDQTEEKKTRKTKDGRDLQDLFLTFSDDGAVRTDEFYVDLFETPFGINGTESPSIIQTAMNQFLLNELATYYNGFNEIEFITSEILEMNSIQDTVTAGGKRGLRSTSPSLKKKNPNDNRALQDVTRTGVEIMMKVYLTFAQKPSPDSDEVKSTMKLVMSNLTYFVSNMTQSLPSSSQDHELAGVYEANRREIPVPILTPPNNTVVEGVSPETQTPVTEESNSDLNKNPAGIAAALPIGIVVAVLIAIVVFFVFRRRSRSSESSDMAGSSTDPNKASALMYMDVENDLYSLDRSVETEQSPAVGGVARGISPIVEMIEDDASSVQYSTDGGGSEMDGVMSPKTGGDSVFSGIETEYNNVRSSKSMMTGYTHASGSTIQVSNLDKTKKSTTPKSSFAANSSLFAFSEIAEDAYNEKHDDDDDDDEDGLQSRPPKLTGSDVSESSNEYFNSLHTREVMKIKETEAEIASKVQSVPPETISTAGKWCGMGGAAVSEQTPPVSHVLADLEGMESATRSVNSDPTRRDPTPTMARASNKEPTPSNANNVVTYNPFNCNPVIPDETTTTSNSRLAEAAVVAATGATVAHVTNKALDAKDDQQKSSSSKSRRPSNGTVLEASNATNPTSPMSNTMPPSFMSNDMTIVGNASAMSRSAPNSPVRNVEAGKGQQKKSRGSGIMGGIFNRSRRKSMSQASSPRSPPKSPAGNHGTLSEPSTPTESKIGGHWIKSVEKGTRRPPLSPRMDDDDDYDMNLSRPSPTGSEFSEGLSVPDYGKTSSRSVLQYGSGAYQESSEHTRSTRRHAGEKGGGDGSAMYQTSAMHPMDWSYKSADTKSIGESTISETEHAEGMREEYVFKTRAGKLLTDVSLSTAEDAPTPKSEATKGSFASSRASASRQLISDLVWLENKIAGVRNTSTSALGTSGIEASDSMSYASNDASVASNDESFRNTEDVSTVQNNSVMSSIVCRDCYAPPGKLNIVIHSTKDGPAVHTVKEGSSLEGHLFAGDLIISVDNVDTRTFTAEQVMKMMASRGDKERKITVLHFEEE